MTEMNEQATALRKHMSFISQEHYCAGWLIDLEYSLWEILQGGNPKYGLMAVSPSNIAKLKALSAECAGWIIWIPGAGESWVDLDTWKTMYANWCF